jgi:hypothetical protein
MKTAVLGKLYMGEAGLFFLVPFQTRQRMLDISKRKSFSSNYCLF